MLIWTTPWGFLKGAAANNATVKSQKIDGVPYKVVTWSPAQKSPSGLPYKVSGYIDADNLVARVETWVEHPVLGDLHHEFFYSGYQSFAGLMAPAKISQKQIGMETFVVAINSAHGESARPRAAHDRAPPRRPRLPRCRPRRRKNSPTACIASPAAMSRSPSNSRTTSSCSKGGQSEARGLAIIAETKRLFPAKKIKYVVNTHPHFDHVGGLAPFVAEGITILVDDNAKFFTEASLGTPRTLVGDVMAKSHKKPKVEGVIEQMELKDETRSLMLYHVEKLEHSDSMLIAYLPKEKILFTADFNVAGAGTAREPVDCGAHGQSRSAGVDFERHVTVHAPNPDRVLTKADLFDLAKRINSMKRWLTRLALGGHRARHRRRRPQRLRCWRTTRSR